MADLSIPNGKIQFNTPGTVANSEYNSFLSGLQDKLKISGSTVLYPLSADDALHPFLMISGSTDVIGHGLDSFGNLNPIDDHLNEPTVYVNDLAEEGFTTTRKLEDFASSNGGIGGLILENIARRLGGTISSVTYFEMDGQPQQTSLTNNAVVEFKHDDTIKRFWYFQADLTSEDSGFSQLIDYSSFDTLFVRAAHRWDPSTILTHPSEGLTPILRKSYENNVSVVTDTNSSSNGGKNGNPKPIWQDGYHPRIIDLETTGRYKRFGYGNHIYVGQGKNIDPTRQITIEDHLYNTHKNPQGYSILFDQVSCGKDQGVAIPILSKPL